MHIEKLYFVQPVIVEYKNEDSLIKRKLVYFDMANKAVINPFVDNNNFELINELVDLMEVSKKINETINEIPQIKQEDNNFIFEKQTILDDIVKTIQETPTDELRKP
jgi:hypothetical protein